MNRTRVVTVALLLVLLAILIGWDVFAVVTVPNGEASVSDVVLAFARAHPPFPFLLGVVAGHLLWPQITDKGSNP